MSDAPSIPRLQVEPAPAIRLGPILIHQKVRTGLREAPWSAMTMLSFVWFTWAFHMFTGGMALTFTVKRYSDNPQVMSLITSIAAIIMLGPFVSYISDKVWTRAGRRRPFLITAWVAGSLGMAGIAFLPEVTAFLDRIGAAIGFSGVSELTLLVCIVVTYTTFYDLSQPIEPLFLECVPPHQRGRFFALRNMMLNCAALFFYQVFWPVFDMEFDVFGWLGAPGVATVTGQRAVFMIAAVLFFVTSIYLLFCVEETKVESAPNMRFRDLGIGKFAKNYFKDVFFAKELYPFYIVLIIPMLDNHVWGNFRPVMQEDQWGYSKAVQAQWGLPMQLLSIFLLVPFAGWYSDQKRRFPWSVRAVLIVAGAGALFAATRIYAAVAPDDLRMLPPVWQCFLLNLSVAAGTAMLVVAALETMLDFTGREHSRAWVATIAVFFECTYTAVFYFLVRTADDGVLPVTFYMAFQQVNGAFTAMSGVFVGPMIYEYIARSKMGTINAGRSLATSLIQFAVPNLGAWWVVFYTAHFGAPAGVKYDYTSLYILQLLLFIPGIAAKVWFIRQVATGRMPRTGVIEVEGDNAAQDAAKAKKAEPELAAAASGPAEDPKLKPSG